MVHGGVGKGKNAERLVVEGETYEGQLGVVNVKIVKEVIDESMGFPNPVDALEGIIESTIVSKPVVFFPERLVMKWAWTKKAHMD